MNEQFLNELLNCSRVYFKNGDMIQRIDRRWFAYKNDAPDSEGGTVIVDDNNENRVFQSLQDAWTALKDPASKVWKRKDG